MITYIYIYFFLFFFLLYRYTTCVSSVWMKLWSWCDVLLSVFLKWSEVKHVFVWIKSVFHYYYYYFFVGDDCFDYILIIEVILCFYFKLSWLIEMIRKWNVDSMVVKWKRERNKRKEKKEGKERIKKVGFLWSFFVLF